MGKTNHRLPQQQRQQQSNSSSRRVRSSCSTCSSGSSCSSCSKQQHKKHKAARVGEMEEATCLMRLRILCQGERRHCALRYEKSKRFLSSSFFETNIPVCCLTLVKRGAPPQPLLRCSNLHLFIFTFVLTFHKKKLAGGAACGAQGAAA
jgi:hypothetical protein